MNKIEHIGIAVKNLESAGRIYESLLGVKSYKKEVVASESVMTEFFQTGESKVELLEATSAESAIHKFIDKKGEGIHHIAFEVTDIIAEMERLQSEGFLLLSQQPKVGAGNKLVCFLHPKTTNSVLIEICQAIAPIYDV